MAEITQKETWRDKVVTPGEVLEKIQPGMSIFLSTGMAEPRTLVRHLMASDASNLQDLEMIQLVSLGDTVSIDARYTRKYRLKTFFSGWIAADAITEGRVDLIPSRFSRVPWLFKSGAIRVDAAFIQISPPDANGYACLGVGMDVARQAMERATLRVGEISEDVPFVLGDTLVRIEDFDYLVHSTEPMIYIDPWPLEDVFARIGKNIASVVPDGSCISFALGPIYQGAAQALTRKKNLGIHSPFITDALMCLVKSGAVTNRFKTLFRGKSVGSYAMGTRALMKWLDRNPLIEFQPLDVITDPKNIGQNDNFIAILPARKADLTGDIALHVGKGNVTAGPGAVQELFMGATISKNGRTLFALPSRNRGGEPNIVLSTADYPFQFTNRESLDMIVTEYGVAYLTGRTVRERAQALIDIAHPDDRAELVRQAKAARILYADQIYLPESGHLYPDKIARSHTFKKNGLKVRFRAIKPSDEDEMRRLFYRFSDQAVYYRYFSPIKTMPHGKMQEYVNVDYRRVMSIVAVLAEAAGERIIAEARYVRRDDLRTYADTAFIVDEAYQNYGIATYLFKMLIEISQSKGIEGFTADVLVANKAMMKVYEKAPFPVKATISAGTYELHIPFDTASAPAPETAGDPWSIK